MRRIPLLLVVMAGALTVISGSALAAAGRTAASPPANSSLPTIGGTAREGQTLTASSGAWAGTTPISYAYQWQRCNSSGSNCGSIGKATSQNYVVSNGDVARTIRVEVTATNADGKNQALSAATAAVAELGSAPANTRQPNPSGTATGRADDHGRQRQLVGLEADHVHLPVAELHRRGLHRHRRRDRLELPDRHEPDRLDAARDGHGHQLGRARPRPSRT